MHPRDWGLVVAEVALVGRLQTTSYSFDFFDVWFLTISIEGGGDLISIAACRGEIKGPIMFQITQRLRLLRFFVGVAIVNTQTTF